MADKKFKMGEVTKCAIRFFHKSHFVEHKKLDKKGPVKRSKKSPVWRPGVK